MALNNLRKILTEEGATQAQLADKSGVSAGTINKVYNQNRSCAPKTNHKILKGIKLLTEKQYSYNDIFPNEKKY
ncbi:MAG: helix-turn-helix transcriptional regulator [Desulfobacteraceae bacterium]|nr:helix-turn-helix transcriptional regulator [Desulfobacteraceae bacterium]MBC2721026.1 helix-turn-helix transcriptional regulator [Desulfobacteraceae bacterium]